MVGVETSDDAAIYKVTDEIAMIQTVDFFTPVVDDPYTFGMVAAANSLSDIYAMGGEPKLALNIVGFPNCLDPDILGEILRGGADKVMEAGAVLAGGHSVQDDEPKYGLCVTGFVHPDKIFKNFGALPGDVLILTKPIGSGIMNTAVKADFASAEEKEAVIRVMTSLNKTAKEVAEHYPVHCCTDVTGFGLAGHGLEMAKSSGVTFHIETGCIPIIEGAIAFANMGLIPEGAYRNKDYSKDEIDYSRLKEPMTDLIFDPQTSGGLLICVEEKYAGQMMQELKSSQIPTDCAVIGRVTKKQEKFMVFL